MFVSILTEKVKKAYWFPYNFAKRVAIFKNEMLQKSRNFRYVIAILEKIEQSLMK